MRLQIIKSDLYLQLFPQFVTHYVQALFWKRFIAIIIAVLSLEKEKVKWLNVMSLTFLTIRQKFPICYFLSIQFFHNLVELTKYFKMFAYFD